MNTSVRPRSVAILGFAVALVAGLCTFVPGPAYRAHLLDLRGAFMVLSSGAWIGVVAVVVSLAGLWLTRPSRGQRGFALALAGFIVGALAFAVPFGMLLMGKSVPPIHDISTDTDSPPSFVSVLSLRGTASNPATYGGPDIARQQHEAYPDIQPVILKDSPAQAFDRALRTARELGWDIVAAAPSEGRIEATDTTPWFGFKDDVVIRVAPNGEGSHVDVRSMSRVGQSDLGKNAQRVRKFLARIGRS